MKTLINLKLILGLLFSLNLQSTIIHQLSFNLYAQDPQLFEHTWYFHSGFLDEEDLILPYPQFKSQLNMYLDDIFFTITHPDCGEIEQLQGEIYFEISSNAFNLSDGSYILLGACTNPEFDFIYKLYSIFYIEEDIAKNPFTYAIENINNYLQLTIENGEGDWAIYNSVLLSTPTFHQNSLTIYPNPVKENLSINNTSNQSVSAIIYNVSGKALQNQTLEASTSSINVKTLKAGLYFVVFENESGEKVSKKFVKR